MNHSDLQPICDPGTRGTPDLRHVGRVVDLNPNCRTPATIGVILAPARAAAAARRVTVAVSVNGPNAMRAASRANRWLILQVGALAREARSPIRTEPADGALALSVSDERPNEPSAPPLGTGPRTATVEAGRAMSVDRDPALPARSCSPHRSAPAPPRRDSDSGSRSRTDSRHPRFSSILEDRLNALPGAN